MQVMLFYYVKLFQLITVIHTTEFKSFNNILCGKCTLDYNIHYIGFLFLLSYILLFKVENDKYYCHVLNFLFCQKSHLYAVLFVFLH